MFLPGLTRLGRPVRMVPRSPAVLQSDGHATPPRPWTARPGHRWPLASARNHNAMAAPWDIPSPSPQLELEPGPVLHQSLALPPALHFGSGRIPGRQSFGVELEPLGRPPGPKAPIPSLSVLA